MTIDLNIYSILSLALIFQGVFAFIILLIKRENRRANRFLAALSLVLALWLCDTFFRVGRIYSQDPGLYFLPIYFSFGFGPLVYFYTRFLTHKDDKLSGIDYFQFLPAVLQGLLYIYLQMRSYEYRSDFWLGVHEPYTYDLELALSFISLSVYLVFSRRLIIRYKKQIENSFSSTQRIALQWLDRLHLVLFAVSFFLLLETVARVFWGEYAVTPLSSITMGIIIAMIAIGALLQSDLTAVKEEAVEENDDQSNQEELTSEDLKKLKTIKELMAEKRLYLQSELTLKEFAKQVNLPSRETSKLINKGLDLSFIDFVNQYRIEHFKSISSDSKNNHLSLLGLAMESGFNSKSTFNRVFKKVEGISPSAFVNAS
ncbi:MAG: AraC family transcriptional regulator [Bacteroidota bacterium]